MGMEEVCGEKCQESDETCGAPDMQGCASADGREIEQESEGDRDDDDHGELGSDGDRQRDAEQHNAAPVPENDFARRVESVGNGDGGEDGSEGSPGGEDFRLSVPDGAGLEHGRRKTVKSEGEESAGVAAEAAGDIPQRSAEEDAEGEKRNARQPAPSEKLEQRIWGQASRGAAVTRESKWGVLGVEAGVDRGRPPWEASREDRGKARRRFRRREFAASQRPCELARRRRGHSDALRSSECTSQIACARKARSRAPARN